MFLQSLLPHPQILIRIVYVITLSITFLTTLAFKTPNVYYNNTKLGLKLQSLNVCVGELDPPTLSPVQKLISPELEKELKQKGFFVGETNSWQNWHILTQGITTVIKASGRTLGATN